MSELFDTTPLRDDPEYWDALTTRVVATVARARTPSLLDWLASPRTGWLATSFMAAAVLTLILWAPDSASSRPTKVLAPLVAPSDPEGRVMTIVDRPPEIDLLLDDRIRSVR
jgi:hypothetical protein